MNTTPDLQCDLEYMVDIRRRLHQCPEVGFELPETAALVGKELEKLGLTYTTKYCKSSLVTEFGDPESRFTIALRADMDALNITELNDIPYKSQHEGKMHACGHDSHTAMLLGAVKALLEYNRKHPLFCRVKAVFQPSEEGMATGARIMTENDVMDHVDFIIGQHVNPGLPVGKCAISEGPIYASNNVFTIDITGKSAHASQPKSGIDAVWMASDLYMRIRRFLSESFTPEEKQVLNVGMIQGGTAVNIVPSDCRLTCTLRTYSTAVVEKVMNGIEKLSDEITAQYGGSIRITQVKELPPVYNDHDITEFLRGVLTDVLGAENVSEMKPSMGSEDFAWYLTKRPGAYYKVGCRDPKAERATEVHTNTFNIDERAMLTGATILAEAAAKYDRQVKNGGRLPV